MQFICWLLCFLKHLTKRFVFLYNTDIGVIQLHRREVVYMSNSEHYLASFNTIDKHLRGIIKAPNYISFYRAVDIASETNAAVRRYKDDLREFANLRNAIVHEKTDVTYVIAEPHDATVDKIQHIQNEVCKPKSVIPLFKREVSKFSMDEPLVDLLKVIKKYSYSQFPVYDAKRFVGLLTENGITRWLTQAVDDESISLSEVKLSDVFHFEREKNNFVFISKETDIYETREIFKNMLDKSGPKLDAVLITDTGEQNEELLGIITAWDMINIS